VGDASLFARALERAGVDGRDRLLEALDAHDFVTLERELPSGLARLATTRGGPEVLEGVPEAAELRELHSRLPANVTERVIYDLGLLRSLGYYTGAVFEVYDAAFGTPIGGGGRYDDLLGRFGRDLPACGWALDIERVHAARVQESA
jgi:ATP phosphoribosyltransferase regulatory subunit HisZ